MEISLRDADDLRDSAPTYILTKRTRATTAHARALVFKIISCICVPRRKLHGVVWRGVAWRGPARSGTVLAAMHRGTGKPVRMSKQKTSRYYMGLV